jgi:RNA polymerase sigma factor (sigma-70 family)
MRRLKSYQGTEAWTLAKLGSFYEEHRSDLVLHASRILKDSAKAEEVVQDALVKFMLASPELDSSEQARAYLHKTISNICIDIFRAEGRRPKLVLLDEESSKLEAVWKDDRDLSETIAAADDAAIVRQALALLSQAERTALVMWEIEGRSTSEIASRLGIKETTVRHTISRARTSLRKILSEWIIDEERGLTAQDLLSSTFKKTSQMAQKSSKIILSLVFLILAYFGVSNINSAPDPLPISSSKNFQSQNNFSAEAKLVNRTNEISKEITKNTVVQSKTVASVSNAKATMLNFPGLDKLGVPTGFTVSDSRNSLGNLYLFSRDTLIDDQGIALSSIAKTSSGAANILLNQYLVQDGLGTSYEAMVSFGRGGAWIPTFAQTISVDSERLVSGNYLLTAVVQVRSEVKTTIVIPASANGRDLEVPPSRVVTRILLNPAKTQILAQAVQVIEKESK